MFFRLRQSQTNNVVLLCIILLAGGMILEIKLFYIKQQKQIRLNDYSKQLDNLLEATDSAEKEAQRTSLLLNQLETILESRKNVKTVLKTIPK